MNASTPDPESVGEYDEGGPLKQRRIQVAELPAVLWAASWFFFVLAGYQIVRPVRETMGSIGGTATLQGLMLATFAVMLAAVPAYSFLIERLPRRMLVRCVYHFFASCLIAFYALMKVESTGVQVWTARAFFVWVNVFALFNTSVFWSVLADLFSSNQGKRLFGMIAAGGTAGAIIGSLLTSQLATELSTSQLLLLPIVTIELGLWCAWRLEKRAALMAIENQRTSEASIKTTTKSLDSIDRGTGLLAGITHVARSPYLISICLFLVFVQACGTQLYFQQAVIVAEHIETREARTQLFAYLDLGTQLLTLVIQAFCSSMILRRFGISVALAILPIVYLCGFASLAVNQSLAVLIVTMIATRAAAYGITVPAREVLFTVVSREDKYKSKSFIDTVVLRGGDVVSGQVFGALRWLGASITLLNVLALPITIVWAAVAWKLGRRQTELAVDGQHVDRDAQ
jgi:AAA family ATP:ADP antiporter